MMYRGFGHNATGGLGHRGKFRGFIAVSFRRNATGFRPQGHLRPPAHPKIARSLGNRRGRRQAAAADERQSQDGAWEMHDWRDAHSSRPLRNAPRNDGKLDLGLLHAVATDEQGH